MISFVETEGKMMVEPQKVNNIIVAINLVVADTRIHMKRFSKKELKKRRDTLIAFSGSLNAIFVLGLVDKVDYDRTDHIIKGMLQSVRRELKQ